VRGKHRSAWKRTLANTPSDVASDGQCRGKKKKRGCPWQAQIDEIARGREREEKERMSQKKDLGNDDNRPYDRMVKPGHRKRVKVTTKGDLVDHL